MMQTEALSSGSQEPPAQQQQHITTQAADHGSGSQAGVIDNSAEGLENAEFIVELLEDFCANPTFTSVRFLNLLGFYVFQR